MVTVPVVSMTLVKNACAVVILASLTCGLNLTIATSLEGGESFNYYPPVRTERLVYAHRTLLSCLLSYLLNRNVSLSVVQVVNLVTELLKAVISALFFVIEWYYPSSVARHKKATAALSVIPPLVCVSSVNVPEESSSDAFHSGKIGGETRGSHGDDLIAKNEAVPVVDDTPNNKDQIITAPDGSTWTLKKTIAYSVPALIYAFDNNLQFYILEFMDVSSKQLLSNLSILVTALLFRMIMHKPLSSFQWFALVLLVCGLSLSELDSFTSNQLDTDLFARGMKRLGIGLGLLLVQTFMSSFANVYTESVFKRWGEDSLHLQNLQLYGYGAIINSLVLLNFQRRRAQGSTIMSSIFQGFNWLVGVIIIVNASRGLMTSVILKELDNMVRFATVARGASFISMTYVLFSCM